MPRTPEPFARRISRRNLLRRGVAAGAIVWMGWPAAAWARRPVLRIGIVRHIAHPLGGHGLTLGIEEAQTSARLFGRTVQSQVLEITGHDLEREVQPLLEPPPSVLVALLGDPAQVAALATAVGESRVDGVAVLNAGCAADELRAVGCVPHLYHIAASEAMQRDAVRLAGARDASQALMWHESLERYGAGQLNARFVARFDRGMGSDDWAAWMALKVAVESFLRATGAGADALHDVLTSDRTRFDGHKGTALSFRKPDRQLRQPLYIVHGGDTADSTEVIESPPRDAVPPGTDPNARLDLLGSTPSDGPCRAPSP